MPPKKMSQPSSNAIIAFNKRWIIRELGWKALDNRVIDAFGQVHFKREWLGCFAWDMLPLTFGPKKYAVVNTGRAAAGGVHWIALFVDPNGPIWVYDSFARSIRRVLPHGVARLRTTGRPIKSANAIAEQRGDSEVCGQISLAFLFGVRDYSIAIMAEGAMAV